MKLYYILWTARRFDSVLVNHIHLENTDDGESYFICSLLLLDIEFSRRTSNWLSSCPPGSLRMCQLSGVEPRRRVSIEIDTYGCQRRSFGEGLGWGDFLPLCRSKEKSGLKRKLGPLLSAVSLSFIHQQHTIKYWIQIDRRLDDLPNSVFFDKLMHLRNNEKSSEQNKRESITVYKITLYCVTHTLFLKLYVA